MSWEPLKPGNQLQVSLHLDFKSFNACSTAANHHRRQKPKQRLKSEPMQVPFCPLTWGWETVPIAQQSLVLWSGANTDTCKDSVAKDQGQSTTKSPLKMDACSIGSKYDGSSCNTATCDQWNDSKHDFRGSKPNLQTTSEHQNWTPVQVT